MSRELFSKEYKNTGDPKNLFIAIFVLLAILVFVYMYAVVLKSSFGK